VSELLYDVISRGTIAQDKDPETIQEAVAALFKTDAAHVRHLFVGQSVVVKRALPLEEAQRYADTLQEKGLLCEVVPAEGAVKPRPYPQSDPPAQDASAQTEAPRARASTEAAAEDPPPPIPTWMSADGGSPPPPIGGNTGTAFSPNAPNNSAPPLRARERHPSTIDRFLTRVFGLAKGISAALILVCLLVITIALGGWLFTGPERFQTPQFKVLVEQLETKKAGTALNKDADYSELAAQRDIEEDYGKRLLALGSVDIEHDIVRLTNG
jgi:hypothetical protein